MINDKKDSHKHLKLAYILISTVMFLPVLLLPLPIFLFDNPMLADALIPTWSLCIALLLMTAVSMDIILYDASTLKQVVNAALWVLVFALVSISALQGEPNIWALALLFFIHSLRSGHLLLTDNNRSQKSWLFLSWTRDILASLICFTWISILVTRV